MTCRYYRSRPGVTQCTSTSDMSWYCTHDTGSHHTDHEPYGKGVLSILSGNYLTLVLILMINPGHKQHMVTPNQWIIPVNIINGLTRTPTQPSMDEYLDKPPHVFVTSNDIWDPTILDCSIDIENDTYHPAKDPMMKKTLHLLMNHICDWNISTS